MRALLARTNRPLQPLLARGWSRGLVLGLGLQSLAWWSQRRRDGQQRLGRHPPDRRTAAPSSASATE